MSPDRLIFILVLAIVAVLILFRSKLPGPVQVVLVVFFLAGFALRAFGNHLPDSLFGTWNVISALDADRVIEIKLIPSEPDWQVNLTSEPFTIDDQYVIDSICDMLGRCSALFPDREGRVWETHMELRTDSDTLRLTLHQSAGSGTIIFKGRNNWKHAELGLLLERHTDYALPTFGNR